MKYLKQYQTHQSVQEMNASVKAHIISNALIGNTRKVLECLAKHSLKFMGACHLKTDTIADELSISRSTVTRCIKKLKDLHVIHVHNNSKLNGIKGANIYAIIFFVQSELSNEPSKMSYREELVNICTSGVHPKKLENESLSFKLSSNNFVNNNVYSLGASPNLKEALKEIYKPVSTSDELCKIGYGRLKQFMRTHKMPYLQMEQIVIRCMQQLIVKQGVRNEFAMYSKMIERQVLQLFEQPIQPPLALNNREKVPEWFKNRHEVVKEVVLQNMDFEAERKKILSKLGQA